MTNILTEKQELILKFIEGYQLENGKSPTVREMREHFNLSSDNSIVKHIKALVKKGHLEKDDTPRGIKLLNSIKEKLSANILDTIKLPLLGYVPAGGPVITSEYINSWQQVDRNQVKNPDSTFMLTVTGDSMINAGIFDGDLLIVDKSIKPKQFDIVVALVDNANTVKRYMLKNNMPYLKAENPDYSDIYPENELMTQGVVIGLMRHYL